MMQWTVRLEAKISAGEVKTTELVTFNRPGPVSMPAEIGHALDETKTLLAKLQESIVCAQVTAYAAHRRVCAAGGLPQSLKERQTRRLQTLFGTVEAEASRFKVCGCRQPALMVEVTVSPVCALLTARCTPELERVQAELGARTSFRDAARIPNTLLPASPANQGSVCTRTHAVALQLEVADRQAAAEVTAIRDGSYWVPGWWCRDRGAGLRTSGTKAGSAVADRFARGACVMAVSDLVNLSGLMDNAKCFAFVRQRRWPVAGRGASGVLPVTTMQ